MTIVILSLFNLTQHKACFNLPFGSFIQTFMPRQIGLKGVFLPQSSLPKGLNDSSEFRILKLLGYNYVSTILFKHLLRQYNT